MSLKFRFILAFGFAVLGCSSSWAVPPTQVAPNPEIVTILLVAPHAVVAQQQIETLSRRLEESPFFEKMRLLPVVSQKEPNLALLEDLALNQGGLLAINGNRDPWLAVCGLRNEQLPLSSMVLPAQTELGDKWIHHYLEAFTAMQSGAFSEAFAILDKIFEKCDELTRQNLTPWTAVAANLKGNAEEATLKLRRLLENAESLHPAIRGASASLLGSLLIHQYLVSGAGLEESEPLLLDAYDDLRGLAKYSAPRSWDLTRQQIILSRFYTTRGEEGDLQRALEFLEKAGELLDRETLPLSAALCYADMGLVHLQLFRNGIKRDRNRLDANHRLRQAEEIFEDLQMEGHAEAIEKIRRFFHTEF